QQVNGEAEIHPGEYEITQYTSVGDTDSGIFYYTTYYNQNINAVDMKKENLEGSSLISYPVLRDLNVNIQN
ncbi:linear amide C-N hydrolase, partial [Dubosiella newyorkensis]